MFTLTPFNDFSDLQHVADVCTHHGIDLRVGIYNNMEYFDTTVKSNQAQSLSFQVADIPLSIKNFPENYDFVSLYTQFRAGNLLLQCRSITDSIVIYPTGDIPLCQNKHITLGNVFNQPLHAIINSKQTRAIHRHHKNHCNQCWVNFHRKYDIVFFRSLEKILPKPIIQLFFSKYHWCNNKKITYKAYMKNNENIVQK